MTKKNLLPIIVLTSICLIVAALLGVTNMLTEKKIEQNKIDKISKSLEEVMPGGLFSDPEEIPEGAPETVTAIYKELNGKGHVITLETNKGYEGKLISLTVGVSMDKTITGVVITEYDQTKSVGKYPESFVGMQANKVSGAEIVSGVTYSSEAIRNAINDALVVLEYATPIVEEPERPGASTTTKDEAIAAAKELMPGEYEDYSIEGMPVTVKAVFREKSGKGYALHIAVAQKYNPLETDAIVTVDESGTITGMKMLYWQVGYDKDKLEAMPECDEDFINTIVGQKKEGLSRVDVVSSATQTSNRFTDSLRTALEVLYPTPVYSIIGTVVISVIAVSIIGAYVTLYIIKRRKRNEK